jgi:hypothetical protein
MIPVQVRSLRFLDELKRRRASFTGRSVSARIQVPPDLRFWYWLEFGTAGRQDPSAPMKSKWGDTYPIEPVRAQMLHWPNALAPNEPSGGRFQFHVDHPGIRPTLIVRDVIANKEVWKTIGQGIGNAMLHEGFRLGVLKAQLLEGAMPYISEQIASNLERAAPHTREDGKLDGNKASDVWREEVEIVDSSA